MKVRIGKRKEGKADVVVVPGRRSRKPPVMARGVAAGEMREKVRELLALLEGTPVPPERSPVQPTPQIGTHIDGTGQ